MSEFEDLESMIEALTLTIAIHEREEYFFQRSSKASSNQKAKVLFLEIADEMKNHLVSLKSKRQKLTDELNSLKKVAF